MKFPKSERLCSLKTIGLLFSKGSDFFNFPFKIKYKASDEPSEIPPKVLFSIPKKSFKRAVDRNLIRRRAKEAYRLNKFLLKNEEGKYTFESIAFIYIAKEIMIYQDLEKKMRQTLERFMKK